MKIISQEWKEFKQAKILILFIFFVTLLPLFGQENKGGILYEAVPVSDSGTSNSISYSNTSRKVAVSSTGIIYVVYHGTNGIRVARSLNRGKSFDPSVQILANNYEAEIAVDSKGVVHIVWNNGGSIVYTQSTNQGLTFTEPRNIGTALGTAHISTYVPYIYVIQQNGATLFVNNTNGIGDFTPITTGLGDQMFSDVHVDLTNGDVIVMADNPTVKFAISKDHGQTFAAPVFPGVDIFFSAYTISISDQGRFILAAGGKLRYLEKSESDLATQAVRINLSNGSSQALTFGDNLSAQGRMLSASASGEPLCIDCYINNGVKFAISNDVGNTFGSAFSISTTSNNPSAAVNPSTRDLDIVYENSGIVYMNVYEGIIPSSGSMDVQGNGISIPHGNTTTKSEDNTDFGYALNPLAKSFTILNTGASNLTIGTITFSDPQNQWFSVDIPPNNLIPAYGSSSFSITYTPATEKPFPTVVNIPNNTSNNPYTFTIYASVKKSSSKYGCGATGFEVVILLALLAIGKYLARSKQRH